MITACVGGGWSLLMASLGDGKKDSAFQDPTHYSWGCGRRRTKLTAGASKGLEGFQTPGRLPYGCGTVLMCICLRGLITENIAANVTLTYPERERERLLAWL